MNSLHGLSALAAEMPRLRTEAEDEATLGAVPAVAGLHPAVHPRASLAPKRPFDAAYDAFPVFPPMTMIPPPAAAGTAAAIDEGEMIRLELEVRARRRSSSLLTQQRAHPGLYAPVAVLPSPSIYDGHHRPSLGPMAYDVLAAAGYPTPSSSLQPPRRMIATIDHHRASSLAALPSAAAASSTEALARAADEAWARVSWLARKERMMIQERMYRDELAQRAAARAVCRDELAQRAAARAAAAASASTLPAPHHPQHHHHHHHQQNSQLPPQVAPHVPAVMAAGGEVTLPAGLAAEDDVAANLDYSQTITEGKVTHRAESASVASDSGHPRLSPDSRDPSATTVAIASATPAVEEREDPQQYRPKTNTLFLPSDPNFLTEVQCFLRSVCIEVFVSDDSHLRAVGKGARPGRIGQVGFRCIHCREVPRYHQTNQAVAYPSTRSNILDSVRNFQRVHLVHCPHTADEIKETYSDIVKRGIGPRRSQKLVREYCAQAAAEIGLIDTPHGIGYNEADDCRRKAGCAPSEKMMRILRAAKDEEVMGTRRASKARAVDRKQLRASARRASASIGDDDDAPPPATSGVKYGKFENIASDETRRIVEEARKHTTPFVRPSDFATVSDHLYLLFHQLLPCRPTGTTIKRRRLDPAKHGHVMGMCCRHCEMEDNGINGMYFPLSIESMGDSSFSQTLGLHLSTCSHMPEEVARALEELKTLGKEHNSCARRGSKKTFMEKVWGRMEDISGGSDRATVTANDAGENEE